MIHLSRSYRILLALIVALSAAPLLWSQAPDRAERRAFVTIRVHADAKLTANGQPTQRIGAVRRFYSPPLEPGKKYSYTFVAEWMPDNNYVTHIVRRKVSVEVGKPPIEVDMRKVDTSKGDTLFVRFVPTPPKIIDAMMELAKVGQNDVVYDLGCGQGDVVIAAVKKFHAKRGVGIDLDAKRIQEAKQKAKEAGVEDKIAFRQGDVFEVKDLADATVVMLYMSNDLNARLMPILKKQLKPGARIVSHRFTMGEWKPDKTAKVAIQHQIDAEKLIHLWMIGKK